MTKTGITKRSIDGKQLKGTVAGALLTGLLLLAGCGGPSPAASVDNPTNNSGDNPGASPTRTAATQRPGKTPTASKPNAKPGGLLDTTFGDGGTVTTDIGSTLDQINDIAIQPDGKIVAVGTSWPKGASGTKFVVARYLKDGSLDEDFADGGIAILKVVDKVGDYEVDYSEAKAVVLQPDGKILVGGDGNNPEMYHNTFAMIRLNPDGSLDDEFGNGGIALAPITEQTGWGSDDVGNAIALDNQGRIIMAGATGSYPSDFAVARFLADGSFDESFGDGGKVITDFEAADEAFGIAVQPDDKIVVSGKGTGLGFDFVVARYNDDGSLDDSFGDSGKVTTDFLGGEDWGNRVMVRPDGRIVVAGLTQVYCNWNCERYGMGVAQYNPDGSLDESFGEGGKEQYDLISSAGAYDAALLPDGRLVMTGHIGNDTFATAMIRPDGTPEEGFGENGLARTDFGKYIDHAYAVAVQDDGKIVVAGEAAVNPDEVLDHDFALVRYTAPPALR